MVRTHAPRQLSLSLPLSLYISYIYIHMYIYIHINSYYTQNIKTNECDTFWSDSRVTREMKGPRTLVDFLRSYPKTQDFSSDSGAPRSYYRSEFFWVTLMQLVRRRDQRHLNACRAGKPSPIKNAI